MSARLTPTEGVVVPSSMRNQEDLSASPLTFVRGLMEINPYLPIKDFTIEMIEDALTGWMAGKLTPSLDAQTQQIETLRQWQSDPEWDLIKSLLNRNINHTSAPMPGRIFRDYDSSKDLVWGMSTISLPVLPPSEFWKNGLNVTVFIAALKAVNQEQVNCLSVEVVRAAAEKCASNRFGLTAPGQVRQFMAQLDTPHGVQALHEHSRWLGRLHELQKGEISMKASENEPKVCFMDSAKRARILSKGSSFHMSLPADIPGAASFGLRKTHLHCSGNPEHINPNSQRLRIMASFNRAVIVDFESPEKRNEGYAQMKTQKFCFGGKIMKADITLFDDHHVNSSGTTWYLHRASRFGKGSVHAALNAFFCLEGLVSGIHIKLDPSSPLTKAHMVVDESALWMRKLGAEARISKTTSFEVRIASKCELCKPELGTLLFRKTTKLPLQPLYNLRTMPVIRSLEEAPVESSYGRLKQPIENPARSTMLSNGDENTIPKSESSSISDIVKAKRSGWDNVECSTTGAIAPLPSSVEGHPIIKPPALQILAAKRKPDSEPGLDYGDVRAKKLKTEGTPSDAVIKQDADNDDTDEFLESMQRELDLLKRCRSLLQREKEGRPN